MQIVRFCLSFTQRNFYAVIFYECMKVDLFFKFQILRISKRSRTQCSYLKGISLLSDLSPSDSDVP